jgi:NAD(P)H-dependent FMN reductase
LTPEYNGTFTSGLKNFIDVFAKEGFRGKPIAVATGSSGSMGGIRAAYQLQQVILSLFAYPQPQMLLVGEMKKKFDQTGALIDPEFQSSFESFIDSFLTFTQKLSG